VSDYFPILKAKAGEFDALRCMSRSQRGTLQPIIELISRPEPKKEGDKPVNPKEHLSQVAVKIYKCWGLERTAFVDLSKLNEKYKFIDGLHQLTFFYGQLRARGVTVNPVIALDPDPDSLEVMRVILRDPRQKKVCIRIPAPDLYVTDSLATKIQFLITELNINH